MLDWCTQTSKTLVRFQRSGLRLEHHELHVFASCLTALFCPFDTFALYPSYLLPPPTTRHELSSIILITEVHTSSSYPSHCSDDFLRSFRRRTISALIVSTITSDYLLPHTKTSYTRTSPLRTVLNLTATCLTHNFKFDDTSRRIPHNLDVLVLRCSYTHYKIYYQGRTNFENTSQVSTLCPVDDLVDSHDLPLFLRSKKNLLSRFNFIL